MKSSYLKGTASFMIALILTLPIYSSFVFALLSNGYIYGETDNIKGYYKRNENINININAKITGDDQIIDSQLHLYDQSGPTFSCDAPKEDKSSDCTYQMYGSSITQNPHQIRVVLYEDGGRLNSFLALQGAFDEQPPTIREFTISPPRIGSGNINFKYNIYDHSYSPTDSNRCSGISKIELSHNGAVFDTIPTNSPPDSCSSSGTRTIPISTINTIQEGPVQVVLTAYDNLNQISSATANFEYDTQGPSIDALEIKDTRGDIITHVRDSPINGIITFVITSDDLDPNSVYADIRQINIAAPTGYANIKAQCISPSPLGYGYICTIPNIQVRLNDPTSVQITITSSDSVGNPTTAVLTKEILFDDTGPSVTSIRTDNVDNGISYAGPSTTFIVELNEEVGINKNDIILDLSNIKSNLQKSADNCTGSGTLWTCYWYDVTPDKSDGEKTIQVSGSTKDKLGNLVTGTLTATVTVDKTAPVVTSSQVTGIGVGVEAFEGYIKTGDIIDITLNIRDKSKLTAYADLSPFVTTQENISGSCTEETEDSWTCEWSSAPIDVPGHITSNINFNIIDFVGNSIQYQQPVEVLNYEDAANVSYWTSSVKCSPSLVDRQVTNLVNQRVYCSVTLHPITPDQETLSISLGTCTDNYNNSLGYIETLQLINAETGSVEPYFSLDLIKGEMTIDKLSIKCPLQIISRIGNKINQEPEIEQVQLDINFYNNPLGEYGEGIENKIKSAKDDAFGGIWKFLGILKKIVAYARLICNTLFMLQKIRMLWETIVNPDITLAHLSMVGTPVEPALGAAKTGTCVAGKTAELTAKGFYFWGEKFCKFINCQLSPKPPGGKGEKGKGQWGNIADSLGGGDWLGLSATMDKAPTGRWNVLNWPLEGIRKVSGEGGKAASGTFEEVYGKQYYQYANARDNLLVAIATGCLPGIINGLDKYRQIKCLYADCLEQNAYNNVPVKICEDQKSYATCKYILGEIFAFLPWTAFFDYYMGMIRAALADPITAIVSTYNVLGNLCPPPCAPDAASSKAWLLNEGVCRGLQFAAELGEIINDVQGIIDSYEQIKGDYCERLDED